VFSTDSYVVSPIFFPGGNIGDLAVNGTVNDIAVCGGVPEYISLSFIIEEGLSITDFWEVLKSIKQSSLDANVRIVTGDTKVVERGKGDKIFVNTSGIGRQHDKAKLGIKKIKDGDCLILSGPIAAHGVTILALRNELDFIHNIQSDTQALNHVIAELLNVFGDDIHFMRDATRGGVAAVLNEISEMSAMSIILKEELIPIIPEVKNLCEVLGIDPLNVANEGAALFICDKSVAKSIVEHMRSELAFSQATIFGECLESLNPKVILENLYGGKRIVQMPMGEQLPRIC
jgi:hydrogenase expression/formation protein HypE